MDVPGGLLALLTLGPCHGAQLAEELAARTGVPMNAGQVAKTLARLERDGSVVAMPRDEAGRIPFRLTDRGRAEATRWLAEPGGDTSRISLVATLPGGDAMSLIAAARAKLDLVEERIAGITARGLSTPRRRGRPPRATPDLTID